MTWWVRFLTVSDSEGSVFKIMNFVCTYGEHLDQHYWPGDQCMVQARRTDWL